jgi:hypothetical protein
MWQQCEWDISPVFVEVNICSSIHGFNLELFGLIVPLFLYLITLNYIKFTCYNLNSEYILQELWVLIEALRRNLRDKGRINETNTDNLGIVRHALHWIPSKMMQ